jgi:tetratricopeptide (TPR) repeat protein
MMPEKPSPAPQPEAGGKAEILKLEEKLAKIDDPAIRAVVLERIVELRSKLPTEPEPELQAEIEPAQPKPDVPLTPPTAEQMERADALVRQAQVEKMRGNHQASTDLMRMALEEAPTAPALLEALGDDAMARGRYKEARSAYERALKVSAKSVSLERKHAESILKSQSALTIEDQLRLGLNATPFISAEDMKASRKAAVFYNAFIPGVGQLALGQTQKGAIILGIWIACLIGIVLLRGDLSALMRAMVGGQSGQKVTMLVLIPIFIALIDYFVALADLKGAEVGGVQKVDRPKPPVDLPFE